MPRRLGQKRQRDQLEIAVGKHAAGAEHVARAAAAATPHAVAERPEAAATAETTGHMHEHALAEMVVPVHGLLLEFYLTIYLT